MSFWLQFKENMASALARIDVRAPLPNKGTVQLKYTASSWGVEW